MREIKFRLRVGDTVVGYEKWYLSSYDGDFCHAKPQWLYSKDGEYWNPEYIHSRSKDQFTGLKDKNGKEIYEGDILGSSAYQAGDAVEVIKFRNGGFYGESGADAQMDMNVGYFTKDAQVIGNICETPNLLTNEK